MRADSGRLLLGAVIVSLVLSACGGGDGDGEPAADHVPPTVSPLSTPIPADGSKSVGARPVISVSFSEPLNPATVNDVTFTVSAAGSPIPGSVSYSGNVATFTPLNDLDPNTIYTARVANADANNQIRDLAGNALAAPVNWRFTPGDKLWATPALLETDDKGDAVEPRMVMDGSGNIITVWQQWDGVTRYRVIMARRYVAGGGWGDSVVISQGPGDADAPQIAMDGGGNAWVTWQHHRADPSFPVSDIWVRRYDATADTWDNPVRMSTTNGASGQVVVNAYTPRIAVSSGGRAVVLWRQSDGPYCINPTPPCSPQNQQGEDRYNVWSIWASYYDGVTWSAAAAIEADDVKGHDTDNMQLAIDGAGNAIAVWQQYDGTTGNAYANRYVAGSGWSGAQLLEAAAGAAADPQVAMDGAGNAIAVWRQIDNVNRYSIYANRYAAGAWGGATVVENDNAGDADAPQIAIDPAGNAIAVWRQRQVVGATAFTRYTLRANHYAGSWGANPVQIKIDDRGDVAEPRISLNANGVAFSVWRQFDGVHWNIWASRYLAGVWSPGALVETNDAGDAYDPSLVIDGNGGALAVWRQRDGGARWSVWSNRFE
ncbi:MAG: Ig-like domain-containing protein [Gammaproteobacteria bacterium]|nr:Ig-like domain-containing protein [Gammaproteobacteria bacterium]